MSSKGRLAPAEKQGMLENFELEVAYKTNLFQNALDMMLESILRRTETELTNIPKEMRNVKMVDLNASWGGNWGVTMQKIKEAALRGKGAKVAGDEEDLEGRVEEMRKRKRAGEPKNQNENDVEGRSRKTGEFPCVRRQLPTELSEPSSSSPNKRPVPASKRTRAKPIIAASVRRVTRGSVAPPQSPTPTVPPPVLSASASPARAFFPTSSIFNPSIPSTPQYPRAPRRNEALRSANGSPLENPWSDSEGDGDNELPDEAEMEKTIMEASTRASTSSGVSNLFGLLGRSKSKSKGKRGVETINGGSSRTRRVSFIRPAYSQNPSTTSLPYHTPASTKSGFLPTPTVATPEELKKSGAIMRVPLPNGQELVFNPLEANREKLERELRDSGMDEKVVQKVIGDVREKYLQLQARLSAW